MSVHRLTFAEELKMWWSLEGELGFDVVTYYGICIAVGYLEGWYIGQLIVGLL